MVCLIDFAFLQTIAHLIEPSGISISRRETADLGIKVNADDPHRRPTRCASNRVTSPPPQPTSRQAMPGAMPIRSNRASVVGSSVWSRCPFDLSGIGLLHPRSSARFTGSESEIHPGQDLHAREGAVICIQTPFKTTAPGVDSIAA
ncbi:MAG: hypothetical protein R2867_31000 [Caldilineaceae bacterium]